MTVDTTLPERVSGTGHGRWPGGAVPATLACAAVLAGVATFIAGPIVLLVVAAAGLAGAAAYRPVLATYLYLATLPFLAGIDRDTLLPLVRPNEAVLALLVAGALAGAYVRYLRGADVRLRFRRLDAALAAFLLVSTVWPILSLMLRGLVPTVPEWAALLPITKLIGLLLLARTTLVTPAQQVRVARLVIWSSTVVAVIAVLQALSVTPVLDLLQTLWPEDGPDSAGEVSGRGTTTFSSAIATGDYLVMAAALLATFRIRDLVGRRETFVAGPLLGAGVLATGQYSSWAAAFVVGLVLLRQYPQLRRRLRAALPFVVVAAVAGAPAAAMRLSEFGDGFGVPRSWLGRWDNLANIYLPRFDPWNFVVGVSPDSVLVPPETWRDEVYLEFGYLQLLWVGGIPLLCAFGWLSVEILRRTASLRLDPAPVGALASTLRSGWWVVLILSLIDIHLVLRGMGDVLFVLLGVVGGRCGDRDPT